MIVLKSTYNGMLLLFMNVLIKLMLIWIAILRRIVYIRIENLSDKRQNIWDYTQETLTQVRLSQTRLSLGVRNNVARLISIF